MQEDLFEAPRDISFPPLFTGEPVDGATDPFTKACAAATLGCDSGLLIHNISADTLRAAIVFAPEVPLEDAAAMLCICGIGIQNALGALAPPEIAVLLDWQGDILLNGASTGMFRAAAANSDPKTVPDWLVIGLELWLIPQFDSSPGDTPDQTSMFEEGCGDISPDRLLESWARHSLVWLNRMDQEGAAPVHAEWRGLLRGLGEDVKIDYNGKALSGTFLGVDEQFGMLIRRGEKTQLVPLSSRIEVV